MIYEEYKNNVLDELNKVLSSIDENELNGVVDALCNIYKNNGKVLGYAAGRMGLGLKAFMMRLNHLGIESYFYGDTYIPPMGKNDMFICSSNSGTTGSVCNIMNIFRKKADGIIVAFVGNLESTMGETADIAIKFKTCNGGLNSADDPSKINSIQPMTTLTEQAMFILFDIVVLKIIEKLNIDIKSTKKYHSNIE